VYQRKLKTGEPVISIYSPSKQNNVVLDKDWWGETTDQTKYGKVYDFNKSFFEQFSELLSVAPLPHLHRVAATMENSEFCNAAANLKNCYLAFGVDQSENINYAYGLVSDKDSQELLFVNDSELCYECTNVRGCYRCIACKDVEDSSDLILSENCIGCNNCIGSFGLRNKEYNIFNVQYTKEEYEKKKEGMKLSTYSGFQEAKKKSEEFFATQPRPATHGRNNQDVSGDYIYQSKNVQDAFLVEEVENSKRVYLLKSFGGGTKDSQDFTLFGNSSESVYDSVWCGIKISNFKFCAWTYGGFNLEYCFGCHSSDNLFGCVGLRKKKYCILNKQYTKEEYEELVPKIKEQMMKVPFTDAQGRTYKYGEFFPPEISLFKYNETLGQDFMPITKEESKKYGWGWEDITDRNVQAEISYKDLPDSIQEAQDDIVGKLISCKAFEEDPEAATEHNCTKVFKVIAQDLAFYRNLGLPLPRYCPNSRSRRRFNLLRFKMYDNSCMCDKAGHDHTGHCPRKFKTTFAPDTKEIVYCEQCYQSEMA
jgi:hypothetical protein